MEERKYSERITSRFETVLRFYWDGVPTPPFILNTGDTPSGTYNMRLLGYSPDYYGETQEIAIQEDDLEGVSFFSNSNRIISARIGSHYSPTVGTFSFWEPPGNFNKDSDCIKWKIRIPMQECDEPNEVDGVGSREYRQYLRMIMLTELYEPLVKEYTPISRDSLRRIVVLSTQGLKAVSKEWVVKELCTVSDEYTRWISQAIFFYMCLNKNVRRILAPLQAQTSPEVSVYKIITVSEDERILSKNLFAASKAKLEESLLWGSKARIFFQASRTLWETKFKRIAMFDLSTKEWSTDAITFFEQIRKSMRAAFTRIRIEFYANIEEFFFKYVPGAKSVLLMSEEEFHHSIFHRIFVATRIFLADKLRSLILEGASKIVNYFNCNGIRGRRITQRVAKNHPVLEIQLVVGERFLPISKSFSRLQFAVADIFEEVLKYANELPQMERAILRTLDVESVPLAVVTPMELACFRSSLVGIIEEVAIVVDELTCNYSAYSTLPTQDMHAAKNGSVEEVRQFIDVARQNIIDVQMISPDFVYCGCFAINCTSVKEQYRNSWRQLLHLFYGALHKAISDIIEVTTQKCNAIQTALERTPTTVSDLEQYIKEIESAELLSEKLKVEECQEVINRISCMEECQVPVENELFMSARKFLESPKILKQSVANANEIKVKCRPLLLDELQKLRKRTRDNIKTVSTGVTELYNMFNMEICDIAAQTCNELRELVDRIYTTVDSILAQEASLGIPTVDSFDDMHPLFNFFDTIEQYWTTIYKTSALRDYYASPVSALNAEKMIDSVREWRRFLHCSTRNLRGFPALVKLGQHQEVALARFEALEDLLHTITTPGMRKTHWKEIARLLTPKMGDDAGLVTEMTVSLQRLIDAGIMGFMPDLVRVASQARSDFEVETSLEEMKSAAKRTYFQLVSAANEHVPRLVVSSECRQNTLAEIEGFILTCRTLRKKAGISIPVTKALDEWEVATEKTRNIFLEWETIDNQWSNMFTYQLTLQQCLKESSPRPEYKVIIEKLSRAADSFQALNSMVKKPQFSLYMAIVQEAIGDHLLIAKNLMTEVTHMLKDILERMRTVFPRFNFLTDEQLSTFLSTYNTQSLLRLLPFMYSRLSSIEITDSCVTAFSTVEKATIPATNPLPLSDELTEVWMQMFDKELSVSLFAAMRSCTQDYYQMDLETWLQSACVQLIEMALRIVHTSDMRDAISYSGKAGLVAYKTKLDNISGEMRRIAGVGYLDFESRQAVAAALMYIRHAESEIAYAMQNNVLTLGELDATAMLQTFMTDTTISVRCMGMDFPYCFEFLGNYDVGVSTPQSVEKSLSFFMLSSIGHTTPLLCGTAGKGSVAEFVSRFMGTYLMKLQCFATTNFEALRSHIRGSMLVGSYLCLLDCELLPDSVRATVTNVIAKANEALLSRKEGAAPTLPLGPEGTMIPMQISGSFGAAFMTTAYQDIPLRLALDHRPIHLPRTDSSQVIKGYLWAHGHTDPQGTYSSRFGVMYDRFNEVDPGTFSKPALVAMLRYATSDTVTGDPMERLFEAFSRSFLPSIRLNEKLQNLLRWSLEHTLAPARSEKKYQSFLSKMQSTARIKPHDVYSRFVEMMDASSNVVIIGPSFSGKTKLWQRWVGGWKYTLLCPSLMSSEDFYGSSCRHGFLGRLADRASVSEPHIVVMEDGDLSDQAIWFGWPEYSRVPGSHSSSFIMSPITRLIVCTRRVQKINPKIARDFALMCLSPPQDWKHYLRSSTRGLPQGEIAAQVIELTLTGLLAKINDEDYGFLQVPRLDYRDDSPELFAISLRCAAVYHRWYVYAYQREMPPTSELDEDVILNDQTFAAQCAIMAVAWGVCLAFPLEGRKLINLALIDVEKALTEMLDGFEVSERLLPANLEQDLTTLVVTRVGWKTFEQARQFGIASSWAEYSYVNPQTQAWSQLFAMPSRRDELCAIECLLDCGQSILLSGPPKNGKSTLLQGVRHCDRWLSQVVSSNKGLNASVVLEEIYSNLARRSTGRFGPQLSRKLIVCIDDVHLSQVVDDNLPLAGQLISFCDKFSAITAPICGFVETTDVVFFGSTTSQKYNPKLMRACVDVFLPDFEGSELLNGLQQLADLASGKRRLDSLPKSCVSFIAYTHSVFTRLQSAGSGILKDSDDGEPEETLEERILGAEGMLPTRFAESLRAMEIVRQLLLSSMSDVQVVTNLRNAVHLLYSTAMELEGSTRRMEFNAEVMKGAEVILGTRHRDPDASGLVSIVDDYDHLCSEDREKVLEWVEDFEFSSRDIKSSVLETLFTRGVSSSLTPETAAHSVLIMHTGAAPPTGQNRTSATPGRMSTMRAASARSRPTSSASKSSKRGSFHVLQGHIVPQVTRTYPTTWLVKLTHNLSRAIQQTNVHLVLVGEGRFGLHRVLRLVCCGTRVPVAIFREFRVGYTFENFQTEIKSVLTFIYKNDARVAVYIPPNTLRIPGVLRQIDILVRSGEIGELFSKAERVAIVRGGTVSQRALQPLSYAEDSDLRRRARHGLSFIVHVATESELKELTVSYPSLTQMVKSPLSNPHLDSLMQKQLVSEIFCGSDIQVSNNDLSNLSLPSPISDTIELICAVYEQVDKMKPLKMEQLIEFASMTRRLRNMRLEKVQERARSMGIVVTRGDEAAQQLDLDAQRRKDAATSLATTQTQIEVLTNQIAQEEAQYKVWLEATEEAKQKVEEEMKITEQHEAEMAEALAKAQRQLTTASSKLRKVKSAFVRSMSVLRLIEKGTLLIKAVYHTLGEDIPNYNNIPSELWYMGLKMICTPEFPAQFASRSPEKLANPDALLAYERDLGEVRYKAIPYAQLLSDFMLAFMNCIRVRRQIDGAMTEKKTQLEAQLESSKKTVEDLTAKAHSWLEKCEWTRKTIEEKKTTCAQLEEQGDAFGTNEKRLFRYVSCVDRFASFLNKDEIARCNQHAKTVEADMVLVAAYYTLLSMHTDWEPIYDKLQVLCREREMPCSTFKSDVFKSVMFPGHFRLLDRYVPLALPIMHRNALYSLVLRIGCRWSLFGGVCPVFERLLEEHLAFVCTGYTTVSAFDPTAKDQLLQAMRNGEGVLLRDVYDQPAIDMIRPLFSLLHKLHERFKHREDPKVRIPFHVFNRDVDVHPKFFFIATSSAIVHTDTTTASQWMNVTNFYTPLPREYRYTSLLGRLLNVRHTADEITQHRELFYHAMMTFMDTHDTACSLLSTDLGIIASEEGDGILDTLETVLLGVESNDGQLSQLALQIQIGRKQVRDAWLPVESTLHRTADCLQFVEQRKMSRPWNERVLDPFVMEIATLSPELASRLAPQLLGDLPDEERYFYVLVNYLDNVIRTFATGWPAPIRGFFSFYVLSGAVHDCQEVQAQRSMLYPPDVAFLNTEQAALVTLLMEGDLEELFSGSINATTSVRLSLIDKYRESNDPVLRRLAKDLANEDEDSNSPLSIDSAEEEEEHNNTAFAERSLIGQLFYALGKVDLERVEFVALQLFNVFFMAVKAEWGGLQSTVNNLSLSVPEDEAKVTRHAVMDDMDQASGGPFSIASLLSEVRPIRVALSEKEHIQRALKYSLPLCISSPAPETTIKQLGQVASAASWEFHWQTLTDYNDATMFTRSVMRGFYERPSDKKGRMIVAYVSPPPIPELAGVGDNEQTAAIRMALNRGLQRLLSMYQGRRPPDLQNGGVTVSLVIVVGAESHNALWRAEHREIPITRCLYLNRDFRTPQQHLLSLLEFDVLAKWISPGGKPPTISSAHHADQDYSGGHHHHHHHNSRDRSHSVREEEEGNLLEMMATLIAKEIVVIHAGTVERYRLGVEEWTSQHPHRYHRSGMDDDNLQLLLQLLRGWMSVHITKIDRLRVKCRRQSPQTENSMSTLTNSRLEDSRRLINITGGGSLRGLDAYHYYRSRRQAWSYLYSHTTASPFRDVPMLGVPVGFSENDKLDLDKVDRLTLFYTRMFFSLFQKFSMQVIAGSQNLSLERECIYQMISTLIVPPSSSAVVTCNFPQLDTPCPLLLDTDTPLSDMTDDIERNPTDLVELCGESQAVRAHRQHVRRSLIKMIFSHTGYESCISLEEASMTVSQPTPSSYLSQTFDDALASTTDDAVPRASGPHMVSWMMERRHLRQLYEDARVLAREPYGAIMHTTMEMVVRTAKVLRQLGSDSFGEPQEHMSIWLPALRFPLLTLGLVTERLYHQLRRHYNVEAPLAQFPLTTILIVTQRQFLTPADVVLEGGYLSPMFAEDVCYLTGWHTDSVPTNRASSLAPLSSPESVVVAVRAVRPTQQRAPERGADAELQLEMLNPQGDGHTVTRQVVRAASTVDPCNILWEPPISFVPRMDPHRHSQRAPSIAADRNTADITRPRTAAPSPIFVTDVEPDSQQFQSMQVSYMSTQLALPLVCRNRMLYSPPIQEHHGVHVDDGSTPLERVSREWHVVKEMTVYIGYGAEEGSLRELPTTGGLGHYLMVE